MAKNVYCIVGPSGSGKTTLARLLRDEHGYSMLDSYTDRPMRFPNEEGHTFISKKEFDNLKGIVAFSPFDKFRRAATAEQIDNSDLYVVDLKGVNTLKRLYKGNKRIVVIYLDADAKVCIDRMYNEGRPREFVQARAAHDVLAFDGAKSIADFIVDASKPLNAVVTEVLSILNLYK